MSLRNISLGIIDVDVVVVAQFDNNESNQPFTVGELASFLDSLCYSGEFAPQPSTLKKLEVAAETLRELKREHLNCYEEPAT